MKHRENNSTQILNLSQTYWYHSYAICIQVAWVLSNSPYTENENLYNFDEIVVIDCTGSCHLWQLPVQPMTKISSKWQTFLFHQLFSYDILGSHTFPCICISFLFYTRPHHINCPLAFIPINPYKCCCPGYCTAWGKEINAAPSWRSLAGHCWVIFRAPTHSVVRAK